jgi:hypothetical protein
MMAKLDLLLLDEGGCESWSLFVFVLPTQITPGAAGEPLVALVAYDV